MNAIRVIFYLIVLTTSINTYSQVNCASAAPFCAGPSPVTFPASTNTSSETGPNYGCLGSQPNPAWYYFQVGISGSMSINIAGTGGGDVDFIAWGPFTSATGNCGNLTAGNTVDCSYSSSPTEVATFPNATAGQYYMLLITNYSGMAQNITFDLSSSSIGNTNCSLLTSSVNSQTICSGSTATLTASSSSANSTYNWMPGGFTTQTIIVSPTITTTYTVTVNGTSTSTGSVTVLPDPTISLIITPSVSCLGTVVSYTASGASAYSYTSTTSGGGAMPAMGSLMPPVAGNITFTVTGVSASGCSNTAVTSILVNPTINPNFTFPTPVGGVFCKGTAIPFSLVNSSNINTTSWAFGDGGVSSLPGPSHAYTANGIYTVTLYVTPSTGTCTATSSQTLSVYTPTASFTVANNCLNTATPFTSTSTSPQVIASYIWGFGDGTSIGTGAMPNHTYANSGTFSTNLLITAVDGCTATVTNPVTIYPNPIIAVSANTVCLGLVTTFNNTSSVVAPDNIATWAWDFDNNGTTDNSTQNPTNTFTTTGMHAVELMATTNNNCRDSAVLNVLIYASPTATFTPISTCSNYNILLNNGSTIPLPDNITTYTWSFGANANPSSTSNSQNPPVLTYNTSGIKTITLTITANTTCTATVTQTIEIYPQPVANFSATSICQSSATVYTDLSTTPVGTITAWAWDFTNNASIDNITSAPTNIFTSSGTFSTLLIVTTSNSCKDTIILPINVWGHSIPDFSPNKVCFGTATTFSNNTDITTNINIGTAPTYSWDFADGTGVQLLAGNPAHTYALGGNINATYNATLTVNTSHNCIDNVVKTVNIYALPTASFTADSVCIGSPSHMLDASNGNGNTVNDFIWDFLSNGTVDATGISNPSFTFPTIGNNAVTYSISSTPVAGLTCSNITNTISVYVFPNPVPNFSFVNKCVNAQPNTFDASSSSVANGTITSFTWAFGDGGTSPTNTTPTHTYAAAGLYNTTLTVTSSNGCVASISKQVEVYQKPIMSITASNSCFHAATSFTAVSLTGSGTVNYWAWDFNNVITTMEGYGQTTNYIFPAAGNQTVHLVASTTNACVETFTLPIYVDYLPTPGFTVDKPAGCPIHCVTFTDNTPTLTAPGLNNKWQWVFGDGTTITSNSSTNQNHCYNNSSSSQIALFDVKLIVTTNKGCKDSLTKPAFIKVYPMPIASYTVDPNPGSIVTPVEHFTNQSVDFTKWWWCFGDGPISDSTHLNPFHTYLSDNADSYYSYLIVANQYGCKDTANVKIEIQPDFAFYIPNAFTPGNDDNINDIFTGMGIGIDKYEMWIFDRWGVSIFYTDDIHKGWNGKVQGKDATVQQDVYIWKVKLKDVLGKKHDYVGHVTLLR